MSRLLDEARFPEWLTSFLPEVEALREPITLEEHYLPEELRPAAPPESSGDDGESEDGEAEGDDTEEEQAETAATRDEERAQERRLAGARSHLIGLAFVRGAALLRLAEALPPDDPRAEVFRGAAAVQAEQGFATMYDAQYFGSHWLASFAVRMLTTPSESAR